MRIKLNKKIRPELRKLIKAFRNHDALAEYLGTSANNMAVMKRRGYLSVALAHKAEAESEGKYSARMLAKRGEIA
jgi:hypothetical protein